jgi:hypothetical protein
LFEGEEEGMRQNFGKVYTPFAKKKADKNG